MSSALPRDFGHYRLTGLLGAGGSAEVFRAEIDGPSGVSRPVATALAEGRAAAVLFAQGKPQLARGRLARAAEAERKAGGGT